MHPDIIAALRLAFAHHNARNQRRRRYAFGGGAYEEQMSPANFYTPQANRAPTSPARQNPTPDQQNGTPDSFGMGNAQPYKWSPLYPATGSGTNIPHPAPPPGASSATTMSGAPPAYSWGFPYSSMGDPNMGAGGTGFKNGPTPYNNQMTDIPPEDPTGDWS